MHARAHTHIQTHTHRQTEQSLTEAERGGHSAQARLQGLAASNSATRLLCPAI